MPWDEKTEKTLREYNFEYLFVNKNDLETFINHMIFMKISTLIIFYLIEYILSFSGVPFSKVSKHKNSTAWFQRTNFPIWSAVSIVGSVKINLNTKRKTHSFVCPPHSALVLTLHQELGLGQEQVLCCWLLLSVMLCCLCCLLRLVSVKGYNSWKCYNASQEDSNIQVMNWTPGTDFWTSCHISSSSS